MAEEYLVVARVVSPQGIKGEVKAEVVTDFPGRFASTEYVYLGTGHRRYRLEGFRLQDGAVVLKLEGVDSIAEADGLRGEYVEVPEGEAVELPPEHYFWYQIIGLRVLAEDGRALGTLEDILRTGANDVYVVRRPEGELLLPAIKQVVKSVDLQAGTMTVELMPGLE